MPGAPWWFFGQSSNVPIPIPASVTPTASDIESLLRSFLLSVLPTGVEVIKGQVNRVAEPKGVDFVVFWPTYRKRLATNIDGLYDTFFEGSILDNTLTVTGITLGKLGIGSPVFGVGITVGTKIVDTGTGTGGVGTYILNNSFVIDPEPMAAGIIFMMQETEVVYQLDVHGPNSADNQQIITTIFRDEFAVEFFTATNSLITPLHADDAKQIPFINDQAQYEDRWVIEAHLQADQTVVVPQQFMDSIVIIPVDVDVAFPS